MQEITGDFPSLWGPFRVSGILETFRRKWLIPWPGRPLNCSLAPSPEHVMYVDDGRRSRERDPSKGQTRC